MTEVYNKNGIPFDIDAIATDLNNKMDRDGVNASCPTLLSRTANSNGGVTEIWSDGYCVQTGYIANTGNYTVTLDVSYVNTDYFIYFSYTKTNSNNNSVTPNEISSWNKTVNSFTTYSDFDGKCFKTEGYIR